MRRGSGGSSAGASTRAKWDLGEKIPTGGARTEGGVADRWGREGTGVHMAAAGERRLERASWCCRLGRRGKFGPRRKKIFFFFQRNFQLHRKESIPGKKLRDLRKL
jgi:hypothetical protein